MFCVCVCVCVLDLFHDAKIYKIIGTMQDKEPKFFKIFFSLRPFPFGEVEQIVDNFLAWDASKMAEIFVNLPTESLCRLLERVVNSN